MKTTDIRDIAVLAAFVSFAYLVVRNYRKKRHIDNEAREFLHFQLF
ncbi:MAG: hypothetical protein LBS52_02465 [Dysgonamonadaceae bacterium]|jgi:hypothetical protein|nr:hypothetical protein [Dysgonamonadaceae bacterium]